jgi:heme exporter protein A
MPQGTGQQWGAVGMAGFAGIGLAGQRGGRRLFGGLDFALPPGGALVLSGPNGSGKSSLLRLMAGFGRPAAGILAWDGADIRDDIEAHRARLHVVGHQDGIKPALTVAETLRFWTALGGAEASNEVIGAALGALGLGALAATPCRLLSSGQRRRLALARLVAAERVLWLLDEPAVGLDLQALAALSGLLARHRAGGGMVVLSTHQGIDLPDAEHLSLDGRLKDIAA